MSQPFTVGRRGCCQHGAMSSSWSCMDLFLQLRPWAESLEEPDVRPLPLSLLGPPQPGIKEFLGTEEDCLLECTCVFVCACASVCTCVCVCACVCAWCLCLCQCLCLCMCLYLCRCLCLCLCVCLWVSEAGGLDSQCRCDWWLIHFLCVVTHSCCSSQLMC